MKRLAVVVIGVAVAAQVAVLSAADSTGPVGRKVENFKLQDYRGAEHSLSDLGKSKLVVIAILGTECPLAKIYGPRLAELAAKYEAKGVAFIGVDANRQDSLSEIAAYARNSEIKFPLLKDPGNAIADKLGAARTPEVFVLDAGRVVRYWGRIDDRAGVGYIRDKGTHDYLVDALEQLLAGQDVKTAAIDPVGCLIGRVHKANDSSEVTYSKQIARILQDRCVECHRAGEIAPFALTEYSEVAGWADMIAEVVKDRRMPPWHADPKHGHFRNDRSLPDEEKELIYKWVKAGAPEGNPADLPEPRKYVEGWSLPQKPDVVLDIQQEPYTVPADGVVEYQFFVVDPGFTEDKWVKMSEVIPGSAPVVHHVLCFVQAPGGDRQSFDENGLGFLAAYVPGFRPTPYPEGMAKLVPAGSKLVFQMHYTPVGKEQKDRSKIGFVFAKPEELTHMIQTVSTGHRGIAIPPHAEDYKLESNMTAYKHDLVVMSYAPHMHLRGKAFSYEAVYPDGQKEMLLDVPHYDFNWQTSYELVEPKVLPPGTRIHCVAHWDNSENNPANPDASVTVNWGDQTWDEMMLGFFDVAVPIDREKLLADGTVPKLAPVEASMEDRARELVSQLDQNGDGKLTKDELPGRLQQTFAFLDSNHDGVLDVEEATKFMKARSQGFGQGGPAGRRGFGQGGEGQNRGGGRNRGARDAGTEPSAGAADGAKP